MVLDKACRSGQFPVSGINITFLIAVPSAGFPPVGAVPFLRSMTQCMTAMVQHFYVGG